MKQQVRSQSPSSSCLFHLRLQILSGNSSAMIQYYGLFTPPTRQFCLVRRGGATVLKVIQSYKLWSLADSGVVRILERGKGWTPKERGLRRVVWVGDCAPSPEKIPIFWIKITCSDALWEDCFKVNVPATKGLNQTSMHCVCRFFVKIKVCDVECLLP